MDANIFMYAAGSPHPNKEPSVRLLERIAQGALDAYVDAETLQEILHRYRAIGRWDEGRAVFDSARRIVPNVAPITAEILDAARILLDENRVLMARDALHAAVYRITGATALCSYDRDFDRIPDVRRRAPQDLMA